MWPTEGLKSLTYNLVAERIMRTWNIREDDRRVKEGIEAIRVGVGGWEVGLERVDVDGEGRWCTASRWTSEVVFGSQV
jgi:hypothetical protein